jgi:hypothetical protein
MLQKMREQKDSLLITILFGIIIVVFVFMFGLPGVDSCQSKNQGNFGHYASHNITSELTRSMIYRYHDDNVFSSVDYPAVARQTTYGIAVVYMLADEARKAGLRVSDEELKDYLTDWESGNSDVRELGFTQHNKFNNRNYENALSRIVISSHDYEIYKREELLAKRYMAMLAASINVSDETLWQDYKRQSAEANLEIIKLTPKAINATLAPITADEILAFVSSNADDIKAYYDSHMSEFTTPAQAELKQIRIQKNPAMLTNPGAKTAKNYQPSERFSVARTQILDNDKVDFDQAYIDFDESISKDNKGLYTLRPLSSYSFALQNAIKGKAINEIVTAEESDAFVFAKIINKTEQVVTPLDEAQFGIAAKLVEENRVKAKTDEVTANIIALVKSGKSMQEALDTALYANVLDAEPVAETAETAEPSDASDEPSSDAENDANDAVANADETPAAPAVPVVLPEDRIKARQLDAVDIHGSSILSVGTNEDLVRDIRNAANSTLLETPYLVGSDTVIARVISHIEPSRDQFELDKEKRREAAIQEKTVQLIGDPRNVVRLTGPYGLWIQQKIDQAIQSKRFSLEEKYFADEAKRRAQKAQEN